MALLTPQLSTNGSTYNPSMAETFSWCMVNNDQNRPMFAKIVYVVNATGSQGGTYLANTNVLNGSFSSIYTVTDTVIAGLSGSATINGIAGVSLPKNITLTGSFSAIQLTSGSIIAYT